MLKIESNIWVCIDMEFLFECSISIINCVIAKPKTVFPYVPRVQRLAPARTRTRVVRLGTQCTDHWTTGQSRGVGVPAAQLTTHVKSGTLYGRTVVRSYIQIHDEKMRWIITKKNNKHTFHSKKFLVIDFVLTDRRNISRTVPKSASGNSTSLAPAVDCCSQPREMPLAKPLNT